MPAARRPEHAAHLNQITEAQPGRLGSRSEVSSLTQVPVDRAPRAVRERIQGFAGNAVGEKIETCRGSGDSSRGSAAAGVMPSTESRHEPKRTADEERGACPGRTRADRNVGAPHVGRGDSSQVRAAGAQMAALMWQGPVVAMRTSGHARGAAAVVTGQGHPPLALQSHQVWQFLTSILLRHSLDVRFPAGIKVGVLLRRTW